jgi:aldehyde dehydrogenase (NAD+)
MQVKMTEPDLLFDAQKEQVMRLRAESAKTRLGKIKSIRDYLLDSANEKRLCEAMQVDLGKSRTEVITTEIGPLLMSIKHIRGNLRDWMRPDRAPTPLNMSGLSSKVIYQSKGNCLIISPWNYPLQLALNPLLYAIAAGNPVILKPSEVSEQTTLFIDQMIGQLFDRTEVAVVQGDASTASTLLKMPFRHIFFTGSPQVGRIVMEAAARTLASVTLELGGKSPAIIDESVNLKKVCAQTAWAKTLNTGQTCIAPDYLILQEKLLPSFIEGYSKSINRFYNPEGKGIENSPDYGRIVNQRHHARLKMLLDEAVKKGAKLELGGENDQEKRFFSPTLLSGVNGDMAVMQQEIFGPILPIVTFREIGEVPAIIAQLPPALSFYIMSRNQPAIEFILENTSSGGAVINDYMVGSINPHLPFGGVNESGIGKANGFHSFAEFSNARGIVKRNWGNLRFLYPPFSPKIAGLVRFLYKYF